MEVLELYSFMKMNGLKFILYSQLLHASQLLTQSNSRWACREMTSREVFIAGENVKKVGWLLGSLPTRY